MKLGQDLRKFIELLNSKGVKYMVVGGHAVVFHGYPRLTVDTNFFVECSAENARRLEEVMHDFGFSNLGLKAKDFLEQGQVIQLGRAPNRIDVLTSIEGVGFAEAWKTRISASLDNLPVPFISKDLLIQNKRAGGRTQDILDLEKLSN